MSTRNTFRADTTLRFSIIVPTHNEEEDIGATLRALCALDHPDFDVLVVDDSSDHTPEIVQACTDRRVRYIRQTRGEGRSAARNQGILAASGEIVVILNADVPYPPVRTGLHNLRGVVTRIIYYQNIEIGMVESTQHAQSGTDVFFFVVSGNDYGKTHRTVSLESVPGKHRERLAAGSSPLSDD